MDARQYAVSKIMLPHLFYDTSQYALGITKPYLADRRADTDNGCLKEILRTVRRNLNETPGLTVVQIDDIDRLIRCDAKLCAVNVLDSLIDLPESGRLWHATDRMIGHRIESLLLLGNHPAYRPYHTGALLPAVCLLCFPSGFCSCLRRT